jgi:transmembrane sensor
MWIFRSRRRIRKEAAEWVARLGGGAGERDHAAFRQWYDADPRHGEAYDRMAAIWSASGQLSVTEPVVDKVPRMGRSWGYAAAASVVALAAVALLLIRGPFFSSSTEPASIYATSRGELRQVELPDGSRVMLDAGSQIELAFSRAERRIVLRQGRARFSVAHESRPFVVQAGANQVIATGTVFDVSLLGDRLSIVLLEGSVELRRGERPQSPAVHRLTAGRRLVVRRDGAAADAPAARGDTSWADRMLEFDDTPLAEAVETANRYDRVQIRLADDEVRSLRVTGAFRAGDSTGLARSLAAAFGLQVTVGRDGNLTLSGRADAR